ncbi:MAG: tyrosine-type recombinase/integrase [Bacteroidetes bacterium]|nr:tyrosine-type recombinase/integrase [Bacteroidota bacterium]
MFISKRSNGYYYIYYDDANGKRQAISTKSKLKKEALQFLTNFSNEIKKKSKQLYIPIDFNSFSKAFIKHSESIHTIKTTATFITTNKYFNEYCQNMNLMDITEKLIRNYLDYRITNSSIYQARKDLINLSSSFNWAISQKYLLSNPCKDIKRFKMPQKLPTYFTKEEFSLLLNQIQEVDIKDIVEFAVNTGLRQMELISLEWSQVNLRERIIILDNKNHITKSKKIRTIPLNDNSLAVLNKRNETKIGQKVFMLNGKEITPCQLLRRFRYYIIKSELNNKLNFHSLRHTFASWLVQAGVSIYQVSKLLGHSDIKTTEVYSHLRSDDLRASINLLNN